MKFNDKCNDRFKLLYGHLWLADAKKLAALNPELVVPENIIVEDTPINTPSSALIHEANEQTPAAAKLEPMPLEIKPIISVTPKPVEIKSTPIELSPVYTLDNFKAHANFNSKDNLITDWNILVDKITDCKACVLYKERKNVVIERGSRNASWMFVGEGPGEDEDRQGRPFVGRSGQLLDKMILAMKLDKDKDVYVCNVVKCRPPYNRNPQPEEISACNNYLRSQLELVKPKVIIALGRFAAQTLLNSTLAIGKLRSKVHYVDGIPLVATYHPAYLLRNPDAKKDAWADLCLALSIN